MGNYILHRKFRRNNADIDTWIYARQLRQEQRAKKDTEGEIEGGGVVKVVVGTTDHLRGIMRTMRVWYVVSGAGRLLRAC